MSRSARPRLAREWGLTECNRNGQSRVADWPGTTVGKSDTGRRFRRLREGLFRGYCVNAHFPLFPATGRSGERLGSVGELTLRSLAKPCADVSENRYSSHPAGNRQVTAIAPPRSHGTAHPPGCIGLSSPRTHVRSAGGSGAWRFLQLDCPPIDLHNFRSNLQHLTLMPIGLAQ